MASEAEHETELCGNCKRDIPLANFTIHEIHCKRKISMCRMCEEPFPTTEMEEHVATEHAPVTCKCKMIMEKRHLEEHERSACSLRLVQCQFCELELGFNKSGEHEDYCGARTERCETCGRSVMMKDLKDHPEVCGKEPEPKKVAHARSRPEYNYVNQGGTWFESQEVHNFLGDHLLSRMPGHLPSRFYGPFTGFERGVAQTVEANRSRVAERRNLARNRYLDSQEQLQEERNVGSSVPRRERSSSDFFQGLSLQNESRASADSTATSTDRWKAFYSKDTKANERPHWQNNATLFSCNNSPPVDAPSSQTSNNIMLPCEFCEELFPEEDLILHQSGCNPRSAFASFCKRSPSPSHELDFGQHKPSFDRISNPTLMSERSAPNLEQPPVHTLHNFLIPCEFCGVQMEEEILFHHQDQCEMCPGPENTAPFPPSSLPIAKKENTEKGFLPHQAPSYLNNLTKDRSGRLSHTVRPSGSTGNLPYPPKFSNVFEAGRDPVPPPHSNLDLNEMRNRNIKDNLRFGRSQHHENLSPPFPHRGPSTRDEFMALNTTESHNPKNKVKTKKINTGTGDVEKEE
ncbi:TRAF-type zinc finger domain-containing protein 1 isoform X1 [Ascaphus truei]|uniref:TRAF-type zinc finger domain-containing protein 1 isoform X1 n=3 Tax=Ascaphus truei TaxID=8439 RepID=UPI003F5A1CBF